VACCISSSVTLRKWRLSSLLLMGKGRRVGSSAGMRSMQTLMPLSLANHKGACTASRLICKCNTAIYPHAYVNKLSVWVLEDCGTQEWILKHSVIFSEVFGVRCSMFDFSVVGIHPDRNVVFFLQHWNSRKLVSYDMDSGELRALGTLAQGYRSITPYVPLFHGVSGCC
jgi:hypothetical protein